MKLSRSVRLHENEDSLDNSFDGFAEVYVEDNQGRIFPFWQTSDNGVFIVNDLYLSAGDSVRLTVRLNDNTTYQSSFSAFKLTPEIDTITYTVEKDGLIFYVSTQDPTEQSKYYRWMYEETWEFTSRYYSNYEFVGDEVVFRTNSQELFRCWSHSWSSEVILGSSEKLSEDVIRDFPLVNVSGRTGKFAHRYSLLVRQRTLSKQDYEFWQRQKANTENLGGLFDPQPTALTGNIRNISDSTEAVLGYFQVYSETQKRIFVNYGDIPFFTYRSGYESCTLDSVMLEELAPGGYLLSSTIMEGPSVVGYTTSTPGCIDCRLRGSSIRPDFWDE